MIVTLNGTFAAKSPAQVVMEVHGVGYAVNLPLSTFERISGQAEGRLWIHQMLGEAKDELYGFVSHEELEIFGLLVSVTGVGGNTALTIMSALTVDEIQAAIANAQREVLIKIKGLGPKTADQVILQLKSKMPKTEPLDLWSADSEIVEESVSGLVSMGYQKVVAKKAVEAAMKAGATDVATIIRSSLKNLSK